MQGPATCPACGASFRNRRGLGGHLATFNDHAHAAYRAAHGKRVPRGPNGQPTNPATSYRHPPKAASFISPKWDARLAPESAPTPPAMAKARPGDWQASLNEASRALATRALARADSLPPPSEANERTQASANPQAGASPQELTQRGSPNPCPKPASPPNPSPTLTPDPRAKSLAVTNGAATPPAPGESAPRTRTPSNLQEAKAPATPPPAKDVSPKAGGSGGPALAALAAGALGLAALLSQKKNANGPPTHAVEAGVYSSKQETSGTPTGVPWIDGLNGYWNGGVRTAYSRRGGRYW